MIDDVRVLLGLTDDSQDSLLSIYEKQAKQKIINRLGVAKFPNQFNYIIVEYMVYKFRKRGTEDASMVKEDVLSKNILSDNAFFNQFENEFKRFLENEDKRNKRTVLRFLKC
mgnify:FL=1